MAIFPALGKLTHIYELMRTLLGLDPGYSAVRVKLSFTFGHLIELEDKHI